MVSTTSHLPAINRFEQAQAEFETLKAPARILTITLTTLITLGTFPLSGENIGIKVFISLVNRFKNIAILDPISVVEHEDNQPLNKGLKITLENKEPLPKDKNFIEYKTSGTSKFSGPLYLPLSLMKEGETLKLRVNGDLIHLKISDESAKAHTFVQTTMTSFGRA